MDLHTIQVAEFFFPSGFGEKTFKHVSVEVETCISQENFNLEEHDYYLSSKEIARLQRASAQAFVGSAYLDILKSRRQLTKDEVGAILDTLQVNATEAAKLIGKNKSALSRLFNEDRPLQPAASLLLLEHLRDELDEPGAARRLLSKLQDRTLSPLEELNLEPKILSEWFIMQFHVNDEPLTNLKLQKLLYYAEGTAMAEENIRLFSESFSAWPHGPVLESEYHRLKHHKAECLEHKAEIDIDLPERVVSVLTTVLERYGIYTASKLRNMTHDERPWQETKTSEKISPQMMRDFFVSRIV